jgi:hypothetical protein
MTAGQVGDVQPARRHVGGHQHRATAVGKLHQHLVALALLQLAIQRQRAEALGLQHAHQVAALLLGVAKRNRRLRAEVVEQLRHRVQALAVFHLVPALLDLALGMLGLHRDLHGLVFMNCALSLAMPSG